jgi:beta-galactosidase
VVNPAQRLDFARYTNDILLECFKEQRDVLHAYAPGIPVTTNFMAGTCPSLDLWSWAREVDLVSNDQYLDASDSRNYVGLALAADLTRSLAGGSPWILMEHSTSAVNWQPRNIAKRPGELSRNSLAHLGRGADAILFFQWRASRYGAEKFHSAMLPHAGPHTRVFREVVDLGGQLQRLAELQGSRVKAQVAILWDWESFWAQDLEWRPSVDLSHEERIKTFYDRLWRDKVAVDFAHPEADLFSYRLVLAPASYLLTDAAAENVRSYVEAGGTLLVSYFSAVVDEHDTVRPGGAGQALADVLGLTVDEFLPLREGEIVQLDGFDVEGKARSIQGRTWSEDVRLRGADVVARFVDGPGAGKPAVTTHALGAGQSWYVATSLDVGALDVVMEEVYRRAGITPCRTLPEDVEVVERRDIGRSYTFVINHTDRSVAMEFTGRDLLAREEVYRGSQVAPGSVRVISSERE